MRRKLLSLFTILMTLSILLPVTSVFAQTDEITSLETEISDLTATLKEKKAALKELKANQDGVYIIETNNATFAFSNPRVYENLLLLDLDYTNDSKGALEVLSDLWMLSFFQEDETSINQLWFENFDLPEVEGRRPLNYQIKIKSGATIPLVIGLSRQTPYFNYEGEMGMGSGPMMMGEIDSEIESESEENSEQESEMADLFDDLSALYIRVDPYASPTGRSEEITIPLE